jgi:hypothetical protein
MNWNYLPLIILGGFIALCVFLSWIGRPHDNESRRDNSPGLDNSMDWHRRNGAYRVMYTDTIMPNGKYAVSQPMSREVADDYAKMHGGIVIDRNAEVPYGRNPNRATNVA